MSCTELLSLSWADAAKIAVVLIAAALMLVSVRLIGGRMYRNRAERIAVIYRYDLKAALDDRDSAHLTRLLARARQSRTRQRDLSAVLAAHPNVGALRLLLAGAAERSGLAAMLGVQLDSRVATARGMAVVTLSYMSNAGHIPAIAALLRDSDLDVRLAACQALGRCAIPRAADHLIAALDGGERVLHRDRIVEQLGARWAIPQVLAALRHGGDDRRIRSLIQAAELAADPAAENDLLAVLGGGTDETRTSAARALGTCGTRRAVEPLAAALSDRFWPVRAQAARALGALGDARAVQPLTRRLNDEAWWVRANSASALAAIGPAGRAALERNVDHPDRYARERVLEELANLDVADRTP